MDYWDDFVKNVYNLLSDYQFQEKPHKYNVKNLRDWGQDDKPQGLFISEENIGQFFSILQSHDISVENVNKTEVYRDFGKLQKLNDIIKVTLKTFPNIHCNSVEGKMSIKGPFVKLNDINMGCSDLKKEDLKSIEIYATNTIFIDTDLNRTDSNFSLTIVAPKWSVIGTRTIQLNGDNAPSMGISTSKVEGKNNEMELPGGDFLGIGEAFINGNNLTIISKTGPDQVKVFALGSSSGINIQTPQGGLGDTNGDNLNESGGRIEKERKIKDFDNLINESKVYFRDYLKNTPRWLEVRPLLMRNLLESFLQKIDTDAEIIDYMSIEGFFNAYKKLERQFDEFSEDRGDLLPYYENLSFAVEKKIKQLDSSDATSKILLNYLYTASLTKLNLGKDDEIDSVIITDIGGYLDIFISELQDIERGRRKVFIEYPYYIYNRGIKNFIEDSRNFIRSYGIIVLEDKPSNPTNNILKKVNKILDLLGEMNVEVSEILSKTKQIPNFLYLGNPTRVDKPREEISRVKEIAQEIKAINVEDDTTNYVEPILSSIHNLLVDIENDIDKFEQEIETNTLSVLNVVEWDVPRVLKKIKYYVKKLNKKDASNTLEGINLIINGYQKLENYYYQKRLSDHINNLMFSEDWPSKVKQTNLFAAITELKNEIELNWILARYQSGVNVVKQYAFPYFDKIFRRYKPGSLFHYLTNTTQLSKDSAEQLERLKRTFSSAGSDDEYIMTDRSRKYRFFVWNHTEYQNVFSELFAGKNIVLNADLESYRRNHAVHFSYVEMLFKAVNKSEQAAINNLLNEYEVRLTHCGNSYYSCGKKIYVVTTSQALMSYSYYKMSGGQRAENNMVYQKISNGDFILSPYTTWNLQLRLISDSDTTFESLKDLHNKVDLKLVGNARYMTTCNYDLDNFYERDEPFELPEPESDYKHRLKRGAEEYIVYTNAASSVSSPINNLFNWISSSLSSSIGRISYLGQLAHKPMEILTQQQSSSMEFFDQVNSLLILAPILMWLGHSYFRKNSEMEGKKRVEKTSQTKVMKEIVFLLDGILKKYSLEVDWLCNTLADLTAEIDSNLKNVESRLITLLIDFLDAVEYDPFFANVKCNHKFLNDVNELMEICETNIPNFGKKIKLL